MSATIKQQKAVALLVENHGNVSKSMREAGYTPAAAKNPKNLTESQGYKELLGEFGPNIKKAFSTIDNLMDADTENDFPNWAARAKGVELTFKAHGISDDSTHVGDNVIINIETYGDNDKFRAPEPTSAGTNSQQLSEIQDSQLAS